MSKDVAWGLTVADDLVLGGQLQAFWESGILSPIDMPPNLPTLAKCPEGGPILR